MTRPAAGAAPDGKTRARLIEVGLQLFSERGFEGVTVRDIAREAKANLGAVNYHFGDKLGLYTEVVRGAIDLMRNINDESMSTDAGMPPEEKIRLYVRTYLPRIARPEGNGARFQQLMRHEMSKPTALLATIAEQAILPRVRYLESVMAELLGCPRSDPRVRRCVVSLQAQCLFYMRDPARATVFPDWPPKTHAQLIAAAEHVAEFSVAGALAIARAGKPTARKPPATKRRARAT